MFFVLHAVLPSLDGVVATRYDLSPKPPILTEVEGVLIRKFRWSATQAQATGLIREFARVVNPETPVRVVTEDEPDNRILECALAAEAEVIISGDSHLRGLHAFQGIPIMSLPTGSAGLSLAVDPDASSRRSRGPWSFPRTPTRCYTPGRRATRSAGGGAP